MIFNDLIFKSEYVFSKEQIKVLLQQEMPEFIKAVENAKEMKEDVEVVLTQDAFIECCAKEMILLGFAVKYAGFNGVTITIIGGANEANG